MWCVLSWAHLEIVFHDFTGKSHQKVCPSVCRKKKDRYLSTGWMFRFQRHLPSLEVLMSVWVGIFPLLSSFSFRSLVKIAQCPQLIQEWFGYHSVCGMRNSAHRQMSCFTKEHHFLFMWHTPWSHFQKEEMECDNYELFYRWFQIDEVQHDRLVCCKCWNERRWSWRGSAHVFLMAWRAEAQEAELMCVSDAVMPVDHNFDVKFSWCYFKTAAAHETKLIMNRVTIQVSCFWANFLEGMLLLSSSLPIS